MKRKSPQRKKSESYAKDRRNTYGENAKATRKLVPKRRQQRSQAERRIAKQELGGPAAAGDETRIDAMLTRVRLTHLGAWKKSPDRPLGEVLERKDKRAKKSRT